MNNKPIKMQPVRSEKQQQDSNAILLPCLFVRREEIQKFFFFNFHNLSTMRQMEILIELKKYLPKRTELNLADRTQYY